jgi:hypothetical protein
MGQESPDAAGRALSEALIGRYGPENYGFYGVFLAPICQLLGLTGFAGDVLTPAGPARGW